MAAEKISAMPDAAALDGTELIPIVQAGDNVKITLATLRAWLFRLLGANQFAYFDSPDLKGDAAILRFSSGQLRATILSFTSDLAAAGFNFQVNSSGKVIANEAQFDSLATFGPALPASLTVVAGVVTAAS